MLPRLTIVILLASSPMVFATEPLRVESESRDAAAAYVSTSNFTIGRMARDCFEILGRTDTPKDFIGAWQSRNKKYYEAAVIYMDARLKEAEKTGGEQEFKKVLASFQSAVQGQGEAGVADFFKRGEKVDVCRNVISYIENKALDITPASPIFSEIEALRVFVATNLK